MRTVYGNVSFDVNRQNSAPFTTLQACTLALVPRAVSGNAVRRDWAVSGNGTFKCERNAHQATALGTTVVVEANSALVPMPAWPRRSCEVEGRCAEAGGCDTKAVLSST